MRNHRFGRLCGVVLAVLMAASGFGVAQAQEVERFIKVTDGDGDPVTDLGSGDFRVEHDGRRVDGVRAELVDQPLRVALIVDDADGAGLFFRYLRDYLPEFVRALPEDSEIGLILLSGRPRTVVDYTDGRDEVLETLGEFFVEEDRAAGFFAGLEETVDRWDEDLRWPILAMVATDGPAQNPPTDGRYQSAMRRVFERGAIVNSLILMLPTRASGGGYQTAVANNAAQVTGGWHDTVAGPSQIIGDKLQEMAAEIRRQYDETRYQYAVSYEVPGGADPDANASAAVGRSGVGLSISASGRPRAAAPAVADASEVGNSREELFNQGEAEFAAGNSAAAAEWFQRAHERDRRWVLPLFRLGLVALNLGDIEGAKEWLQQAVDADGNSAEGQQAAAILASLP